MINSIMVHTSVSHPGLSPHLSHAQSQALTVTSSSSLKLSPGNSQEAPTVCSPEAALSGLSLLTKTVFGPFPTTIRGCIPPEEAVILSCWFGVEFHTQDFMTSSRFPAPFLGPNAESEVPPPASCPPASPMRAQSHFPTHLHHRQAGPALIYQPKNPNTSPNHPC